MKENRPLKVPFLDPPVNFLVPNSGINESHSQAGLDIELRELIGPAIDATVKCGGS